MHNRSRQYDNKFDISSADNILEYFSEVLAEIKMRKASRKDYIRRSLVRPDALEGLGRGRTQRQ